jgi:hypothetical protein
MTVKCKLTMPCLIGPKGWIHKVVLKGSSTQPTDRETDLSHEELAGVVEDLCVVWTLGQRP